jgi:recombination protein RecT
MTDEIVAVKEETKQPSVLTVLSDERVSRAFHSSMSRDQFLSAVATAVRASDVLKQCTRESFLAAVVSLAQLGLTPLPESALAYLVPRHVDGAWKCTPVVGYRGLIQLAYRYGGVQYIHAATVREGDIFEWSEGTRPSITHVPRKDSERGDITHAYAIAHLSYSSDIHPQAVVTRAQIDRAREKSMNKSGRGPWHTHYDAMAMKVAVRVLYKFLPQSYEMEVARQDSLDCYDAQCEES